MDGDGDRFDKSRMFKGHFVRQAINDAARDCDSFRERTVPSIFAAGDSKNTAVIAKILSTSSAKLALAARNH